jgi:hypothetical protein
MRVAPATADHGSAALLIGGALLAGMLHSHTSIWLLVAVSALLGLPNGFNNLQPPDLHRSDR